MKNLKFSECPSCGLAFYSNHANRKYCSTQCHNNFNNEIRKRKYAQTKIKENELKIIEQNDLILKKHYIAGIKTIDLKIMECVGFDKNYFTTVDYISNVRFFYYIEYKLLKTTKNKYEIIKINKQKENNYE